MTKRLVIFALAVMTFAAAPHALKAADADTLCPRGNATVRGTYIAHGNGSIVGVGPISTVGVMTFDGKGTGFLTATTSVNGEISKRNGLRPLHREQRLHHDPKPFQRYQLR